MREFIIELSMWTFESFVVDFYEIVCMMMMMMLLFVVRYFHVT